MLRVAARAHNSAHSRGNSSSGGYEWHRKRAHGCIFYWIYAWVCVYLPSRIVQKARTKGLQRKIICLCATGAMTKKMLLHTKTKKNDELGVKFFFYASSGCNIVKISDNNNRIVDNHADDSVCMCACIFTTAGSGWMAFYWLRVWQNMRNAS